jgi:hypothetical protein
MKTLKQVERKLKPDHDKTPSSEDPVVELRRLVRSHRALTMRAVAFENSVADRTAQKDIPQRNLKKGDAIKSDVPEDAAEAARELAKTFRDKASRLESAMIRQLKKIPIYREFLADVYGFGAVCSAYLVAEVDINKAVRPSNLRRFCGLAVIDGRLERRTPGVKLAYNGEMRTRIFQAFSAMWRNSGGEKRSVDTKYLRIWHDYRHRMTHSARVDEKGKIVNGHGKTVSAKGFAHSTGWHKAADVFLTDLYMVWRALDGLPVWCPYVADKLGYWHGSDMPAWQGGKMLTVDEAKTLVGPHQASERKSGSECEEARASDLVQANAMASEREYTEALAAE